VVNCRLKAVGPTDRPDAPFVSPSGTPRPRATRPVHFDTGWHETPVFDRAALPTATTLTGPAVIDEMSATTLLPPGWRLTVDPAGNLLLESA
jgi:N-methylhydantoinase A